MRDGEKLMTLRANEIGADVYSTTNTDLDKNNLGVEPQEVEEIHDYPELRPGRALLAVDTAELIEFVHRVPCETETVEGTRSPRTGKKQWTNEYETGQDWGGLLQHHFISYAKREAPSPNQHDEIHAPLDRPSEAEITDMSPDGFERIILFNDNEPRPLLLMERPEVSYEEVVPGETYDVVGWYDPTGDCETERVKPVSTMAHRFPEIAGVDGTKSTTMVIPEIGLEIQWDDVDARQSNIKVSPEGDDIEFSVKIRHMDFHVEVGVGEYEDRQLFITNPYDANDLVKGLDAYAGGWNSALNAWPMHYNLDALTNIVSTITDAGHSFTIDASIIENLGESRIDVTPDEYVEVDVTDVLEATFTETVEIGEEITLPELDVMVSTDMMDGDVVRMTASEGDAVTVTDCESASPNHVTNVVSNTITFTCDREHADLVKSLDWGETQYEYDFETDEWTLNASGFSELVTAFVENDQSVTVAVDSLSRIGESEPVTVTQTLDVDDDEICGLERFASVDKAIYDYTEIETNEETTPPEGMVINAEEADGYTLTALNMALTEAQSSPNMTIDLGDVGIDLQDSVKKNWYATESDDDTHSWRHQTADANITVEEVEGWGTEYAIHIEEQEMANPEHVVTLADERMVVNTVIMHMNAITSN